VGAGGGGVGGGGVGVLGGAGGAGGGGAAVGAAEQMHFRAPPQSTGDVVQGLHWGNKGKEHNSQNSRQSVTRSVLNADMS